MSELIGAARAAHELRLEGKEVPLTGEAKAAHEAKLKKGSSGMSSLDKQPAGESGKISLRDWFNGMVPGGEADEPGQYRVYLTNIPSDVGLDDQLNDLWKEAWAYLGKLFPEKYNIKTRRAITTTLWIQGEAMADYDDPYPKPVLMLFEMLLGVAGLNPNNSLAVQRLEHQRTTGKYLPLPVDKNTGRPVGQMIHDGKTSWVSIPDGKPVEPNFG